jgi:hypothetical protein
MRETKDAFYSDAFYRDAFYSAFYSDAFYSAYYRTRCERRLSSDSELTARGIKMRHNTSSRRIGPAGSGGGPRRGTKAGDQGGGPRRGARA